MRPLMALLVLQFFALATWASLEKGSGIFHEGQPFKIKHPDQFIHQAAINFSGERNQIMGEVDAKADIIRQLIPQRDKIMAAGSLKMMTDQFDYSDVQRGWRDEVLDAFQTNRRLRKMTAAQWRRASTLSDFALYNLVMGGTPVETAEDMAKEKLLEAAVSSWGKISGSEFNDSGLEAHADRTAIKQFLAHFINSKLEFVGRRGRDSYRFRVSQHGSDLGQVTIQPIMNVGEVRLSSGHEVHNAVAAWVLALKAAPSTGGGPHFSTGDGGSLSNSDQGGSIATAGAAPPAAGPSAPAPGAPLPTFGGAPPPNNGGNMDTSVFNGPPVDDGSFNNPNAMPPPDGGYYDDYGDF